MAKSFEYSVPLFGRNTRAKNIHVVLAAINHSVKIMEKNGDIHIDVLKIFSQSIRTCPFEYTHGIRKS